MNLEDYTELRLRRDYPWLVEGCEVPQEYAEVPEEWEAAKREARAIFDARMPVEWETSAERFLM